MKPSLFLILVVCCSCVTADEPIPPSKFTPKGHTTDSLDTVKTRVKAKQAVLIDIRENGEWDNGHLKIAKLIPMSVIKADELTDKQKKYLPKKKPVYIHCASGRRVLTVVKLLKAKGYDVRPLTAGYRKLLDAGFEKASDSQR